MKRPYQKPRMLDITDTYTGKRAVLGHAVDEFTALFWVSVEKALRPLLDWLDRLSK